MQGAADALKKAMRSRQTSKSGIGVGWQCASAPFAPLALLLGCTLPEFLEGIAQQHHGTILRVIGRLEHAPDIRAIGAVRVRFLYDDYAITGCHRGKRRHDLVRHVMGRRVRPLWTV